MRNEKRIALVIGNGDYTSVAPLRNAVNDARAVATSLKRVGFEVTAIENGGRDQIMKAVEDFGERLHKQPTGVGLFYFAGHGIQARGNNYLLPVEANPKSEGELTYVTVDTGYVLSQFDGAPSRVNMVILDACRDNPLASRVRSTARGLAVTSNAPGGTLVVYATSPNKTALDGDGANGLFTEEFLRYVETPGLKIEDMFKRVAVNVEQRSGGEQIPWLTSSLRGDFFFKLPN